MPRPAVCSQPGCPNLTTDRRCPTHTTARPTAAALGYDARWQRNRRAFLDTHPECQGDGTSDGTSHHPNCDGRATVADHHPHTRRQLVAAGDSDPDAWHHLVPRSASCHGRKTVLFDGGWGHSPTG